MPACQQPSPPTEAGGEPLGFDPADILLNYVVSLLMPLFITAAGGELSFARMAALATIDSYRGRTKADLLTILQIITFSLGAADSVCRSMADDLSLPMVLRLRGSANSTARTAERNRLVLTATTKADPAPPANPPRPNPPRPNPPHREPPRPDHRPPAPPPSAAPLPASPAAVSPAPFSPLDAAPLSAVPPDAAPSPASPSPAPADLGAHAHRPARTSSKPVPPDTEDANPPPPPASPGSPPGSPLAATESEPSASEIQQLWANAMSVVAAEFAADLDHLPPDERQTAQTRIRALNHCAVELRSGHPPPRPRPGDLGAATPNPA
ncbi:hypothetical protein [Rhodopila sp.]|uniref:hypothetical protein n=1 Tax=Rhodopila sp. TaxID=2480087 RepID=UPI003D1527D5